MIENKWQHFVPQFYFKHFSTDTSSILGYHLKSNKHYRDSIVNQAAKNYFYSDNIEIEKSFSPLEGKFESVLKKVIATDNIRKLTEEEYFEMLRFIAFQKGRTEKAKKTANDYIDKLADAVLKPMMKSNKELMSKVTEKDVDDVKISYPAAFLIGVIASLESNILLADLVPALLINKTEKEFIFSDNPVISYNLIYRDPSHSMDGNQSPGLLIFCPISPVRCIMLFDSAYYSIKLNDRNFIELNNEEDINALNKLQFHNSLHNIYYQSESQKDNIDKISQNYFSQYSKNIDLTQIKEVPRWKGDNASLLVSSSKGIPEKIVPSFIQCGEPLMEVMVIRDSKLNALFDQKMKLYGLHQDYE